MGPCGVTVPWRLEHLHTGDAQIRDGDGRILAVFEFKTQDDQESAMHAQVAIDDPPCELNVGRYGAQRQRIEDMGCYALWVIKGVRRPSDLRLTVASAMWSLEMLSKTLHWCVAEDNADVMWHVSLTLSKILQGDTLAHHEPALVDLPAAKEVEKHQHAWCLQAIPGLSIPAAMMVEAEYPTAWRL